MKTNLFRLSVFVLLSAIAHGETVCPDPDNTNRYVTTKLRNGVTPANTGQIKLFYKLLKPFDPSKPTLLMINGGPGGTHEIVASAGTVASFLNVVGFDHRGIGCTKILTPNSVEYEPFLFSMDRSSDDIEAIRKDLLGENGKWFIYGISYGTMLAQQYAIKYPSSSLGLILDSASHKVENFTIARNQYLKLFIEQDPQIHQLFEKVVERYPNSKVPLLRKVFKWTYFYRGRTVLIRDFFKQIIAAPDKESAEKIYLSPADAPFVGMAQQIICEELYDFPPTKTEYFWPALDQQCSIYKSFSRPMDFSQALKTMNIKTLLLGGRFDPVTPIQGMREMQTLMPDAFLFENQYAGHGIFVEKSKCAFQIVGAFIAGASWSQIKSIAQTSECSSPPDASSKGSSFFKHSVPF